jgi:hypothetical protein
LVGPGLAKKWRPRGFWTVVLMRWTFVVAGASTREMADL